MCEALDESGRPIRVAVLLQEREGTRTSHHLIFVSKHPLGYKIMKTVMANESLEATAGVASFEYNPASADQPLLSGLLRPLDELEDMLVEKFAGRTLSMIESSPSTTARSQEHGELHLKSQIRTIKILEQDGTRR